MTKPLKEYKFRYVGGIFANVTGDSETLADILQQYEIIIDDRTQFARLYDYERGVSIWYKAYGFLKVTITIWKIEDTL